MQSEDGDLRLSLSCTMGLSVATSRVQCLGFMKGSGLRAEFARSLRTTGGTSSKPFTT